MENRDGNNLEVQLPRRPSSSTHLPYKKGKAVRRKASNAQREKKLEHISGQISHRPGKRQSLIKIKLFAQRIGLSNCNPKPWSNCILSAPARILSMIPYQTLIVYKKVQSRSDPGQCE